MTSTTDVPTHSASYMYFYGLAQLCSKYNCCNTSGIREPVWTTWNTLDMYTQESVNVDFMEQCGHVHICEFSDEDERKN